MKVGYTVLISAGHSEHLRAAEQRVWMNACRCSTAVPLSYREKHTMISKSKASTRSCTLGPSVFLWSIPSSKYAHRVGDQAAASVHTGRNARDSGQTASLPPPYLSYSMPPSPSPSPPSSSVPPVHSYTAPAFKHSAKRPQSLSPRPAERPLPYAMASRYAERRRIQCKPCHFHECESQCDFTERPPPQAAQRALASGDTSGRTQWGGYAGSGETARNGTPSPPSPAAPALRTACAAARESRRRHKYYVSATCADGRVVKDIAGIYSVPC
jgi:hypothetical protein